MTTSEYPVLYVFSIFLGFGVRLLSSRRSSLSSLFFSFFFSKKELILNEDELTYVSTEMREKARRAASECWRVYTSAGMFKIWLVSTSDMCFDTRHIQTIYRLV